MPDEQQARPVGIAAFVRRNQVIAVLCLPVKGSGEAKIGETILKISPYTVNTRFGKGAGVNVHNGLEIFKIWVQHIFGSRNIGMFYKTQITPPVLNCSISIS